MLSTGIDCASLITNPRKRLLWRVYKKKRIKHIIRFLRKKVREPEIKERGQKYRERYKSNHIFVLKKKLIKFCDKDKLIKPEDIINKFGPNPICYLTGLPINYSDASTYHLDHIIPRSKGGLNTLDNLQLASP
jgi:5-methylcytosine-specific restriction endonuclease McrA